MSNLVSKFASWSVILVCVLLPLQTHYLFGETPIQGVSLPWTEMKLYAVDILIIAAIWLTFFRRQKISVSTRNFFLLAVTFWLMLLLTNMINHAPAHSWVSLLRIGECIGFAWVVSATRVPLRRMLVSFISGMFVVALVGLWQFAVQHIGASSLFGVAEQEPWIAGASIVASGVSRFLRSYGSFPHPNIFAGYLAVAFILTLYLSLRRSDILQARRITSAKEFFSRNGWTIIVLVLSTSLLFTFSRNGWLAAGVGALLLIIVSLHQNKKSYFRIWTQAAVVGGIIFIAFGQLFLPLAFGRVTLEDPHEQVSIHDRQRAIHDFVDIFKTSWLTGTGLNQFTDRIREDIDSHRDWSKLQPVHNIYLLVAAEASLFSAVVFLLLFFVPLVYALGAVQKHAGSFPGAGLSLAILVMLFLMGMFDHYLFSLAPGLFLLFFGFGVSLRALDGGA